MSDYNIFENIIPKVVGFAMGMYYARTKRNKSGLISSILHGIFGMIIGQILGVFSYIVFPIYYLTKT